RIRTDALIDPFSFLLAGNDFNRQTGGAADRRDELLLVLRIARRTGRNQPERFRMLFPRQRRELRDRASGVCDRFSLQAMGLIKAAPQPRLFAFLVDGNYGMPLD